MWLPLHEFYFYPDGRGRSYYRRDCKRCYNAVRSKHGYIRASRMHFTVEELVVRLGLMEAARRSGVSPTTLRKFLKGQSRWMQHPTASKLIRALREARANNEVRHIDSVRHGAAKRGRKEKQPVLPNDYYRPRWRLREEQEAKRLHELDGKRRSLARARRRRRKNEWARRKRTLVRAARMRGVDSMDLYWQTAEAVCTPKQLRVLELRERHGFSLRQIALACDIALGTVRVHLDAAHRNIHKALKDSA